MKSTKSPFNIKVMDIRGDRLSVLRPVKVTDIYEGISSNFHPDGVFSTAIFGRVGEDRRDSQFSYIDIKTEIFHPVIFSRLSKLKGLYEEIISGKGYAVWDESVKDFVKSDELDGETGYSFFMKHWKKIDFKRTKSPLRDDRIKLIEKYKDIGTVNKILVLPAGLRDFEIDEAGRQKFDDINTIYWRIVSISNTLVSNKLDVNDPILDTTRFALQKSFNEIFEYFETLLSGKTGFLQSKWGSRRVFNGTRNVISSMDFSANLLGAKNQPAFTDTVVGMYQLCKAALPLTIHLLKEGFLSKVFGGPESPIPLVDKNTMKLEHIKVPADIYDQWNTMEGLEKVINNMSQVPLRHKPIEIMGRYLGLIYIGPDNTFKIFNDVSQLPEGRDIKDVQPLTLCHLIYLSGYKRWNGLKGLLTRYPVTGIDSIYPCTIYVKTTIKGDVKVELNDQWEITDEAKENPALEFPVPPYNYLDSLIPSPVRLKGLGADFDGDMCSLVVTVSDEANKEIEDALNKKEAYLDSAGGFRASSNVMTYALVLKSMTSEY